MQTSPPVGEPLSPPDAVAWLRREPDAADLDLIAGLIRTARRHLEKLSGRCFLTAGYTLTLDDFPGNYGGSGHWGGWPNGRARTGGQDAWTIRIPLAPLQGVSAITYTDLAGNQQTLPEEVYDVDTASDPGRISLAQYQVWPVSRMRPGCVSVAFTAGYGDAAESVPEEYTTAIAMLVAHWYEHRGEDGNQLHIPPAVEAMLASNWNGELEYGT